MLFNFLRQWNIAENPTRRAFHTGTKSRLWSAADFMFIYVIDAHNWKPRALIVGNLFWWCLMAQQHNGFLIMLNASCPHRTHSTPFTLSTNIFSSGQNSIYNFNRALFAGQWWVVVMFAVCVCWRGKICPLVESSNGGKNGKQTLLILPIFDTQQCKQRGSGSGEAKNIMKKPWRRHMSAREGRFKLRFFFSRQNFSQYFKWKHVNLLAFDDWEKSSSSEIFCFPARELNKHTTHESWMTLAFFFCFSIIRLITVASEREKWDMRVKYKLKGAELSASAQLLRCIVYTSEFWLN